MVETLRFEPNISCETQSVLEVMSTSLDASIEELAQKANVPEAAVEHVGRVLEAYKETRSCDRASLQEGVYYSPQSVARVVRAAVNAGVLDAELKNGPGAPKADRGRVLEVIEVFPNATRRQQAQLAGVSETTVYRALPDEMKKRKL